MNKRTIIPYMSRVLSDISFSLSSKNGTLSSRTPQSIRFYCLIVIFHPDPEFCKPLFYSIQGVLHSEPEKLCVGS